MKHNNLGIKVVFCMFLLSYLSCVNAQNIKIASFQILPTDLSARITNVKDLNGDECALIKVVTSDFGYSFSEIVKQVNKPNEIWLYVPQGSKRITIRHPKYGILRNYEFNMSLDAKVTYEMKMLNNIEVIVHEDAGGQYLIMNVVPKNALVFIDGIPENLSDGYLSKLLKYGRHRYKIEAPLYQSEEGEIEIDNERKKIAIQLKPDYGSIEINSAPEQGAIVYLDNILIDKTPLKIDQLDKGKHWIKSVLPMYQPIECITEITVNQTSTLKLNFIPNFAKVKLTAYPEEEIWINNERKAKGIWTGRLTPGLYTFETRKDAHRPSKQTIELKAQEDKHIQLESPTPIYGSLNVNTTPVDTKVFIDGKELGVAPNIFNKILVGKREIEIRKPGCLTKKMKVNIQEGIMKDINISLSSGREITLKSNLKDAKIFVDQKLLGTSPIQTTLTYATHTITAKSPAKNLTRTITINSESPNVLELNDLMLGEALGNGWYKAPFHLGLTGQIASPYGYGYMATQREGCIIGHKLYIADKTYGQKINKNGRAHLTKVVGFSEYDLETGKHSYLHFSDGAFNSDYKLCLRNGKVILFSTEDEKAYIYQDGTFMTFPYNANMKKISNEVSLTISASFPRNAVKVDVTCREMYKGKDFYFFVARYDYTSSQCYFYIPNKK